MLFEIDEDDGRRITGWIVPDHPSIEPAVIVAPDGGRRSRIAATGYRRRLREERLHATGICGFVVDEATCPDLLPGAGVSIFEEESNVLVYRRATTESVPIRHFHLETDPSLSLGDLRDLFQISYGSVEFLGEESVVSLLNIAFTPSVFVSGAVLYRRFEPYLGSGGFRRSILLCDPTRALAARLLRAKEISRHGGARSGWRHLGMAEIVEGVATLDLTDANAVSRALERLSDDAVLTLSDPLVRRLAVRDSQDAVRDEHVGVALDSLASFDVIGFDDDLPTFVGSLEMLFGRRLPGLDANGSPGLQAVADALDRSGPAIELGQLDRALVATTREALAQASSSPTVR